MLLNSFYVATIFLKLKVFIKIIQEKFQIFVAITNTKLFKFSIVTSKLKLALLKCISTKAHLVLLTTFLFKQCLL